MYVWHARKDDGTLQAPPAARAVFLGVGYSVLMQNQIPRTSVPTLCLFSHLVLASLGPLATRLQSPPRWIRVVHGLMIPALQNRNRQSKLFLSRLKKTRNRNTGTAGGAVEVAFGRTGNAHFVYVFRHC